MRRFRLINSKGDSYDITTKDAFFHDPEGLGFQRDDTYHRVGSRYILANSAPSQGEIKGKLNFISSDPYADYRDFLEFCIYDLQLEYEAGMTKSQYKNKGELAIAYNLAGDGSYIGYYDLSTGIFTALYRKVFYEDYAGFSWEKLVDDYTYELVDDSEYFETSPAEEGWYIVTIKSLTGSVVNFSDAVEDSPIDSIEVALSASQNITSGGPWPAGANVNKWLPFSGSSNGIIFSRMPNGRVHIYGVAQSNVATYIASEYYTLPWNGLSAGDKITVYSDSMAYAQFVDSQNQIISSVGGASGYRTGQIPSNAVKVRLMQYAFSTSTGIAGMSIDLYARFLIAKGAVSSWTPYSNICSITGVQGTRIYHEAQYDASATSILVSWQSEAGAIYGGSFNPITGILTVEYQKVTFTGDESEDWQRVALSTANYYYIECPSLRHSDIHDTFKCDTFPVNENEDSFGVTVHYGIIGSAWNTLRIQFNHIEDTILFFSSTTF